MESGFHHYPTGRDKPLLSPFEWLEIKKRNDRSLGEGDPDLEAYWRVHDSLYDLSSFRSSHPGGSDWIDLTKGGDITELVESSHLNIEHIRKMLIKFHVKDLSTPRFSRLTFKEDGFYNRLRTKCQKVIAKVGINPTWSMMVYFDLLFFLSIIMWITGILLYYVQERDHHTHSFDHFQQRISSFMTATYTMMMTPSSSTLTKPTMLRRDFFLSFVQLISAIPFYLPLLLGGMFFGMNCVQAHNWFHKRMNLRMFVFDFAGLSSLEWRISHTLSHHPFPNTVNDFELVAFEPFVKWLVTGSKHHPIRTHTEFAFKEHSSDMSEHRKVITHSKNIIQRYFAVLHVNLLMAGIIPIQMIQRIKNIIIGVEPIRWENLLQISLPCLTFYLSYLWSQFTQTTFSAKDTLLYIYLPFITATSYTFTFLGLIAAHHEPTIWHAGDPILPSEENDGLVLMQEYEKSHITTDSYHSSNNKEKNEHENEHDAKANIKPLLTPTLDWGELQLLATRDRHIINNTTFVVSFTYGEHILHHLFPTIDHSKLHYLQEALEETCEECGIDTDHMYLSQQALMKGLWTQAARTEPKASNDFIRFDQMLKKKNKEQKKDNDIKVD